MVNAGGHWRERTSRTSSTMTRCRRDGVESQVVFFELPKIISQGVIIGEVERIIMGGMKKHI